MNTQSRFTFFKKPTVRIALLAMVALILAACKAKSSVYNAPAAVSAPTTAPIASPTAAAAPEATINVATDPKLGQILVDGKGMTLYMFTKDGPDKSNCNASCLATWPPLLTKGNPTLGTGVNPALVGSATLADGSMIVTYNKMPLYYWIKDAKPGDTTGEGVGSVWYVVSPDGRKVGAPVAATSTPAPVAATSDVTINVYADPKLGQILVDGKGMTLYMYTVDGPDQSNCTGGCLAKWPPFLTQGKPMVGAGVDASLVGTAKLADGTLIVTYNHMPLYYWVNDTKPGDTTGQDVGSVWYVVNPDGKPVGK